MRKILCVDTELTCFDNDAEQKDLPQELIEFGIAVIDVETLTIVNSGNYYVKNTRKPISEFNTTINHITQKMLDRQGLELQHVANLLVEKWGTMRRENPVVFFGNEPSWMRPDFEAKGVKYCFHDSPINIADYLRFNFQGTKSLKRASQKKLAAYYGVEVVQPAHSAKADAETLAKIVIAAIKAGDIWPALAK